MRIQYHILLLIAGSISLQNAAFAQVQYESKMVGTKHDLSATGTGSVIASTEKQVCIFCHTPHVPREQASAQLWNHQLSSAEYTLYSSDYLTSLNYAVPNQPNARSKLCLSCHDGTIAIGAVYNNGGNGNTVIPMQNNITTMPQTSRSNLGTSLANDHPVGFVYDNAKDAELVARAWPWETPIKLDPDASNGTLECHTCHDPHDNNHKKFLRISNYDAALCVFCHNKIGWSESIHNTSTQNYTPAGESETTVGEWACRNCHTSHGGLGTPYLLHLSGENTCLTAGCHGAALTGTNTKNIQSEIEKLYAHPVLDAGNKHKNPDDEISVGMTNRHSECQDCHDSHQAKKGLHSLQNNTISGVLQGARGVIPGYATIWTQPNTFTEVKPASQEYQICYRCHSYYAFGKVPAGVTSILGPSHIPITDQAMEFNQENRSVHPVQVSLDAQNGSFEPRRLKPFQMNEQWSSAGSQTMYCSDCHGNDQPTTSSVPQGPHGSNNKFMLTGNAKYWPTNSFENLWSLNDIKSNSKNWQNDLFCVNCHPLYDGNSFFNNVHNSTRHLDGNIKCITCHLAVPHGSKRSRLIGYASDVTPFNYLGEGVYDKLVIDGFKKAESASKYEIQYCSTTGVCHGTQSEDYEE
jgi:predicted CXXCH cytochrome family protein